MIFTRRMLSAIEAIPSAGAIMEDHGFLLTDAMAKANNEQLKLFLLWDPEDGVLVDGRYQLFGSPALVAFTEIWIASVLRKNHLEIRNWGQKMLLEEAKFTEVLPKDWQHSCDLLFEVINLALAQCTTLPSPARHTPIISPSTDEPIELPQWEKLTHAQKLELIEKTLDREVRPYVAMDEGGIEVVSLSGSDELTISYAGSCTSCISSVGSTLGAITEILQQRVYPQLTITVSDSHFSNFE